MTALWFWCRSFSVTQRSQLQWLKQHEVGGEDEDTENRDKDEKLETNLRGTRTRTTTAAASTSVSTLSYRPFLTFWINLPFRQEADSNSGINHFVTTWWPKDWINDATHAETDSNHGTWRCDFGDGKGMFRDRGSVSGDHRNERRGA